MNYKIVLDNIFKKFNGPRFGIRFWDNETKYYGNGEEANFILSINSSKAAHRILTEGALGFGESYMNQTIDINGDLESYLSLRHQFKHIKPSFKLILLNFWLKLIKNRNRYFQISHHYDLGNDFFSIFLDRETMQYSAAYFDSESVNLHQAQINKLRLICDWIKLPQNSRIIDLGSGWGGFAIYASKNRNWVIDGKTLSKRQLDYCNDLIVKEKIKDLISINFEDFTSINDDKIYDGAVMIEALEHVGKDKLLDFFININKKLKPGAPYYLQFTGRYKPKKIDTWTEKYVFPGGYLPSKNEFLNIVEKAGFNIEIFEDHTDDYKKTMAMWINSIESNKESIEKKYGPDFFRLWKLWTHGAKVNFEIGDMSLFRVLLRKN